MDILFLSVYKKNKFHQYKEFLTIYSFFEKECIEIGTICKVINIAYDEGCMPIFCITPLREFSCNTDEYWYLEKDVEKGHLGWIKE